MLLPSSMASSPYVDSGSYSDDDGDGARRANTSQDVTSSGSDAESEVEPDGNQFESLTQMPTDFAVVEDGLHGMGVSTASVGTR